MNSNLHPIMQQALRPFMPKPVLRSFQILAVGHGGMQLAYVGEFSDSAMAVLDALDRFGPLAKISVLDLTKVDADYHAAKVSGALDRGRMRQEAKQGSGTLCCSWWGEETSD